MNNATRALGDIQHDATSAIATSLTASDAERTSHLKAAARALVDAREHFFTRSGEPDWLGRTYAYRTWVREVMSRAHVPNDEITNLQAAIRYHSGNALREKLDGDEVEALGLRKESPTERSRENRERASATLQFFTAGPELIDPAEIRAVCRLIETALGRVNAQTIGAMPARARRETREALRRVADRAGELAGDAPQ